MQRVTVSIADDVYVDIKTEMLIQKKENFSEFVEMLIRKGLVSLIIKKKEETS